MLRLAIVLVCVAAFFHSPAFGQSTAEQDRRFAESYLRRKAAAPNPLNLKVDADPGLTAGKRLDSAGGSLVLETPQARYKLTIPEDALFYPADISLTAIRRIEGLGAEAAGALAVKIEPSGLPLAGAAWLEIVPADPGAAKAPFFPFGFFAGGLNAHYSLFRRSGGGVEIMVPHFSGFGMGLGAAATQALGQSKIALPTPDATRVQRDAAVIADEHHSLMGAANDAIAGDDNVSSSDGISEAIMGIIRRVTGPGGVADPVRDMPAGAECSRVDQMIANVNAMRQHGSKNSVTGRTKLAAEQWQLIKRCAEPPVKKCYSAGDPWPLIHYLKSVRVYKPDPEELPVYQPVVAWLENEIAKCARYEFSVQTTSKVEEDTAIIQIVHGARLAVPIDLRKAASGSRDIYFGKGKGVIASTVFECKVKGVKCVVTGASVRTDAAIEITLKDLPVPLIGGPNSIAALVSDFDPLVKPPFVDLKTRITAKGISIPIEYELVNAFWRCNFDKEYRKNEDGYRFGSWDSGTYPEIFRLDIAERSKACGGKRAFKTAVEMVFRHKPEGQFQPLP